MRCLGELLIAVVLVVAAAFVAVFIALSMVIVGFMGVIDIVREIRREAKSA